MSTISLYSQVVIDHYRHPRNRGRLLAPTHAADGVNPLCGDRLRVEIERGVDLRIDRFGFSGEACAIAVATASMLGQLLIGRDDAGIARLHDRFSRVIEGEGEDAELGPLNAMSGLATHPTRRPCALLPWAAVLSALAGTSCASTERAGR